MAKNVLTTTVLFYFAFFGGAFSFSRLPQWITCFHLSLFSASSSVTQTYTLWSSPFFLPGISIYPEFLCQCIHYPPIHVSSPASLTLSTRHSPLAHFFETLVLNPFHPFFFLVTLHSLHIMHHLWSKWSMHTRAHGECRQACMPDATLRSSRNWKPTSTCQNSRRERLSCTTWQKELLSDITLHTALLCQLLCVAVTVTRRRGCTNGESGLHPCECVMWY